MMKTNLITSLIVLVLVSSVSSITLGPAKAVVVLDGSNGVTGKVTFEQAGPDAIVQVTGTISGLTPQSQRGLHVHEFGNLIDGCESTGGHFNPQQLNHGAPDDSDAERHVGDFGNVSTDDHGMANLNFANKLITLYRGENSIIGRSLAVHSGTDDLGKGHSPDSQTTGASGAKVACGVIGIASENY